MNSAFLISMRLILPKIQGKLLTNGKRSLYYRVVKQALKGRKEKITMVITDRLEEAELVRILTDSGLWESPEEVRDAVEKMEGFTIIAREGRHIDRAIGDYFIDDCEFLAGEIPAQWVAYIDSEAVGRDIRLSGDNGIAVDLLEDSAGGYGGDWKYFVIRDN